MAINVLLVEDDEILVKRIQNHFAETEFTIEVDSTGADALSIVRQRVNLRDAFTLAIIDIVLPKIDGLQLAKELNTLTDIGVIVLSSRDSQADRIAGLAQGADDYICKPVDLLELELRMRALYKRVAVNMDSDESEEFIEYADFKLHPDNRTLITSSGVESRLTEAEHKVLICLISNAGKALPALLIKQISTLCSASVKRDSTPEEVIRVRLSGCNLKSAYSINSSLSSLSILTATRLYKARMRSSSSSKSTGLQI